jgi:predicted Zn-dependent protease with MMP-like domain
VEKEGELRDVIGIIILTEVRHYFGLTREAFEEIEKG